MKRAIYTTFMCLLATGLFAVVGAVQVEEMAIGNTFGCWCAGDGDGRCLSGARR